MSLQLSKSSVAAARENLEVNDVSNVFMIRMSRFEYHHMLLVASRDVMRCGCTTLDAAVSIGCNDAQVSMSCMQ